MIVKYTCLNCGLIRRDVEAPARPRSVDLQFWLEIIVAGKISEDHESVSPQCRARTMTDLMIPINETDEFIGQEKKEGK